jgi:hypothetical protein
VLLGVVEPAECTAVGEGQTLEVEEHRGCHERAGEGPPPGLVGSGDEAAAKLTVEGEETAAGLAAAAAVAPFGAARAAGGRRGWCRRDCFGGPCLGGAVNSCRRVDDDEVLCCARIAHDPGRIIGRAAGGTAPALVKVLEAFAHQRVPTRLGGQ